MRNNDIFHQKSVESNNIRALWPVTLANVQANNAFKGPHGKTVTFIN